MGNTLPVEGNAAEKSRLHKAREVYDLLYKELLASLKKLEAEGDTATETKARADLFRSHLKQLQSVFEIEGSLDTYGQRQFATRIDLDAARDEIRARLDRFRQRGGG